MNAAGVYGPRAPMYYSGAKKEEEPVQTFKLVKPPCELDQLDIVWNIAL